MSDKPNAPSSPFALKNIRLFIAFRIFFNARFYYPVFTVLFLDYGLSLEQFALLNTVWAITIVCAEVPSGALADILGRKRLLVITSVLMIIELSVIAFVPLASGNFVFWAFFINRILSGLAEAAASGADEAIAYDSLVQKGLQDKWPNVLSLQMRISALAGVFSMTVGALVYDPQAVNTFLSFLGTQVVISQQTSMRFPVYLTLLLAILAFRTTTQMQEYQDESDKNTTPLSRSAIGQALLVTWQAGIWISKTPFALVVICFGMVYDHILRLVITLTSRYFREIQLPEASFGIIMAALSLLGLVIPKAAEFMVARFSPLHNCLCLALITLSALWGLTGFMPLWGILPMALVMSGLMMTAFFTSHYLNQITAAKQRATVLSFKGLAFNLAYGLVGILFALTMQHQRSIISGANGNLLETQIESTAFQHTIFIFPWYTMVLIILLAIPSIYLLKQKRREEKKKGKP